MNDDHLEALLMTGTDASSGFYTPERVTLNVQGSDEIAHRVVYLHEVHHAGLNGSTAWGAALHLFAALGEPQRGCFRPLLDACRAPHEAFATFAGISVAGARHAAVVATLAHYPLYEPLYRTLEHLCGGIAGPQRRYLAATAIARVSMQTPILERLLEHSDLTIRPADLRAIDTPNGRWRFIVRHGRALLDAAAVAADDLVVQTIGDAPLIADAAENRADDAVIDAFDTAWGLWETAVFDALADALRAVGATPLTVNGHMAFTEDVLQRARDFVPDLGLHAARIDQPAPDDRALSASTIQRTA